MNWTDSHCHLARGRLRPDLEGAIARAREAGVTRLICAASDLDESKAAVGVARAHEAVRCLAGVHPHDAVNVNDETLRQIAELAAFEVNVAVGEIGLDYHYDYSPRADQRRAFAAQLDLARSVNKRVVIHTREAFEDTLAILSDSGVPGDRLLFHSVTEEARNVRRMLQLGALVSFSGIVTFKKTGALRDAARLVPDDRLLVETDAPFLSPEPVRKMKTNEPANVVHVGRCLADVRGTSAEALAEQTTANAVAFFSL